MRQADTGLFLFGWGLYKARAAQGRNVPNGPRIRESGQAGRTLEYDWIERNIGMALALSVVVPVKDEAENVAPLAREIAAALTGEKDIEIIFIDDGSTDATASVLKTLKTEIPSLRVIQHGRNIGQSRAVRTGVRAARSEIIVTLDGDGQNDPADIPKLLAELRKGGERLGLVSGVRTNRQDDASKKFASRFANNFRRRMLNDGATDTGCGLKAFRREAFIALPYFDHLHRFLIALMLREGYDVRYVEVGHRPRLHGRSKYGVWDRLVVGISDIFGVRWLQKRFRGAANPEEI